MPLYREDLQTGCCEVPGCGLDHRETEIYLHPGCHPDAPPWPHHRGDVLTLECSVCRRRVASFVICSRDHEA
jgi:hypothetical protein